MLTKLKGECGHQYTQKLEGMLQDIASSQTLTQSFQAEQQQPVVDMKITILTTGFWPNSMTATCSTQLPPMMKTGIDEFVNFYTKAHQGRRISWNLSLGSAEVRARLGGPNSLTGTKKYELSISTYQMCLLECFNDKSEYSYDELLERTKIPVDEFNRHLQSLYANPKTRILVKTAKSAADTESLQKHAPEAGMSEKSASANSKPLPGDTFAVNESFDSRTVRVKIRMLAVSTEKTEGGQNGAGLGGKDGRRSPNGKGPALDSLDGPSGQASVDVPASVEEDRRVPLCNYNTRHAFFIY